MAPPRNRWPIFFTYFLLFFLLLLLLLYATGVTWCHLKSSSSSASSSPLDATFFLIFQIFTAAAGSTGSRGHDRDKGGHQGPGRRGEPPHPAAGLGPPWSTLGTPGGTTYANTVAAGASATGSRFWPGRVICGTGTVGRSTLYIIYAGV